MSFTSSANNSQQLFLKRKTTGLFYLLTTATTVHRIKQCHMQFAYQGFDMRVDADDNLDAR